MGIQQNRLLKITSMHGEHPKRHVAPHNKTTRANTFNLRSHFWQIWQTKGIHWHFEGTRGESSTGSSSDVQWCQHNDCLRSSTVCSAVQYTSCCSSILALLLYHKRPTMQDIYFVSEAKRGRGGKMIGGKCINISSVQTKIGADVCQCMLAIHSIGAVIQCRPFSDMARAQYSQRLLKIVLFMPIAWLCSHSRPPLSRFARLALTFWYLYMAENLEANCQICVMRLIAVCPSVVDFSQ